MIKSSLATFKEVDQKLWLVEHTDCSLHGAMIWLICKQAGDRLEAKGGGGVISFSNGSLTC